MATLDNIKHFSAGEFKHLDLVNQTALELLDQIRDQFGLPLTLTDDARLPGDIPPGGSATSLHFKGQAFDIRGREFNAADCWKLADAVHNVANWVCRGVKSGVEFEIVLNKTDGSVHHFHVGFFLGARSYNTLVLRVQ